MKYPKDLHKQWPSPSDQGGRNQRVLSGTNAPYLTVDTDEVTTTKKNGFYVSEGSEGVAFPIYEFYTSEHIDSATLGDPDATPTTPSDGFVYYQSRGSGTRVTGAYARPIWSDVFDPPEKDPPATGKKWGWRDPYIGLAYGPNIPSQFFVTPWSWQNQKFPESILWLGNKQDAFVTSTQAAANGIAGMTGWCGFSDYGAGAGTRVADRTFDIPVTLYKVDISISEAPDVTTSGTGVWWRKGAVQKVGERYFFIMADTHGRFWVWPATYEQAPMFQYRAVPQANCQVITPPYPEWVTLPTTTLENERGQWFWQFNKDATKVVSVPFNRVAGEMWVPNVEYPPAPEGYGASEWHPYAPSSVTYSKAPYYKASTQSAFTALGQDLSAGDIATNGFYQGSDDTPGLVEFMITIEVTGPEPGDFEASFTLGRTSYWGDDKQYYVDAAYLLNNEYLGEDGMLKRFGYPEDTLVTAEVEVWFKEDEDADKVKPKPAPKAGSTGLDSEGGGGAEMVRGTNGQVWVQNATRTVMRPMGYVGNASTMGTYNPTTGVYIYPDPEPGAVVAGGRMYPKRIARYVDPDAAYTLAHMSGETGMSSAICAGFLAANCVAYYVVRDFDSNEVILRVPLSSRYMWYHSGKYLVGINDGAEAPNTDFHNDLLNRVIALTDHNYRSREEVELNGVDLRSMSFTWFKNTYEKYPKEHPLYAGFVKYIGSEVRVMVWGKEIAKPLRYHRSDDSNGEYVQGDAGWPQELLTPEPPEGYKKLPIDGLDLDAALLCHQSAAQCHLRPLLASGINVHPSGSWSYGAGVFMDEDDRFDVIQAYSGTKAAPATSHRKMFNKAFKQNRTNAFYEGIVENDIGGFCISAIWSAFTPIPSNSEEAETTEPAFASWTPS